MTSYEIIKNQSKEMLVDTIADYIALALMEAAMYGVSVNYEDYQRKVAQSLDSEDIVSDAEHEWRLHPQGFGQYCLDMLKYKIDEQKRSEHDDT